MEEPQLSAAFKVFCQFQDAHNTISKKILFVDRLTLYPLRRISHLNPIRASVAMGPREDQLSLRELLVQPQKHSATDPRDKIYGILGLIDDQNSSGIRPNYLKDLDDLFGEVIFRLWDKTEKLQFTGFSHS
ncbi:hypothetical protein GQ53DRAFT_832673 [Thozetella sp. PMI_491]|nr:hypothetical protein GQ53DRAFT_832673 [Thozetella sp. PMI_491]